MDDKEILAETNVILKKYLAKMGEHLESGKRTNIIEFINSTRGSICTEQFYSSVLTKCEFLVNNDKDLINNNTVDVKYAYRKVLIFTIALYILSNPRSPKYHDFTACIKNCLEEFPYLAKVIYPANYIAELDAKDLVWSGRLLNQIKLEMSEKKMTVEINNVIIKELNSSEVYAYVKKNGQVIINLPKISKIALFDSPNMGKKIIIENCPLEIF
jgi:hypothetical protein